MLRLGMMNSRISLARSPFALLRREDDGMLSSRILPLRDVSYDKHITMSNFTANAKSAQCFKHCKSSHRKSSSVRLNGNVSNLFSDSDRDCDTTEIPLKCQSQDFKFDFFLQNLQLDLTLLVHLMRFNLIDHKLKYHTCVCVYMESYLIRRNFKVVTLPPTN